MSGDDRQNSPSISRQNRPSATITMANKEKRFETIYTQGTSLSIVVDTETGVNYLVHDTGITPLLDKNGTVVITEINK